MILIGFLKFKKLYILLFIFFVTLVLLFYKKKDESNDFNKIINNIYTNNGVIGMDKISSNIIKMMCEDFSFELIDKTRSNAFLFSIYKEIINLKGFFFNKNNKNCIYIVVGSNQKIIAKKNFVNIQEKTVFFYGIKMRQISIVYNGLIIKKTFVINERYLRFDKYLRINILKKLLKRRLIQYKNNFCKTLNLEAVEHLIILLLMIRCVPIVNKEWLTYLPLIDNDFYWTKAIVILDSETFFNAKYLYKHPSLIYQRNEIIMYGRNLLMWNFKNLTPIVSNILTFLEKLFTGDISEKVIRAVNLYKEDKKLFEIERYKQPVTNKFTVIFTTFKRTELLNISMAKLDSVPNIDKIIVIWNNPSSLYLPDKNSWCRTISPKFFIKTNSNSLNNKFLPYDIIKTEAVLTLDDDQSVDEHLLQYLFEVWKQHKDVIVGYYRRFGGNDYERSYITTYKHIYNLILTGLSFINRKYLHYFTYKFPAIYKKKIDMRKNCEDIAFNYLVSIFSNKPNIAYGVEHQLSLIKKLLYFNYTGLSLNKRHYKVRKYCTLELNRLFVINPLISNAFYMQEFFTYKKKANTTFNYSTKVLTTTTNLYISQLYKLFN